MLCAREIRHHLPEPGETLVEEIFARGWENFVARTTGPMSFRFIIQPTVAVLLAIRAGLKDARDNKPPFLWSVLTNVGRRRALMREGFKDTGKVILLAMILDSVYQLTVQRGVYTLELIFTAATLACVPYLLVRGPVSRIAAWASKARERRSLGRLRGGPYPT
jgi:hypothetical protein